MKPSNRTYITLIFESLGSRRDIKSVQIGSVPGSKIREFQNHGQRSSLWQMVTALVDTQYQNDRLIEIQARGGVCADWEADYVAPPLKRPAVVGYGPCAGILSTEVWA